MSNLVPQIVLDKIGLIIGQLEVIDLFEYKKGKVSNYVSVCDCGNFRIIYLWDAKNKKQDACKTCIRLRTYDPKKFQKRLN